MNKSNKYSPEVKERAVRMVQEHRSDYPSLWATVDSIAPKIGCSAHTLLEWVRKHETNIGLRDGVTSEERECIKAMEREVTLGNDPQRASCGNHHHFLATALLHTQCQELPDPRAVRLDLPPGRSVHATPYLQEKCT